MLGPRGLLLEAVLKLKLSMSFESSHSRKGSQRSGSKREPLTLMAGRVA
jgi:hypothetical protein